MSSFPAIARMAAIIEVRVSALKIAMVVLRQVVIYCKDNRRVKPIGRATINALPSELALYKAPIRRIAFILTRSFFADVTCFRISKGLQRHGLPERNESMSARRESASLICSSISFRRVIV